MYSDNMLQIIYFCKQILSLPCGVGIIMEALFSKDLNKIKLFF